jgi:DedD protein
MANSPTQGATDSDVAQDAQTELKRRARRRLIGASALALLAVVVLPMVMDHDPRPPAQDIQVRIPSQDGAGMSGGLASRILPGKAPTPLPPAAQSRPEAMAEAKPEIVSENEAKATMPAKPEVKAPAAAGGGEWVVRLGAYKDAANVKQLQAKLKGMGVPSYTEKFDSPQGPRMRVRAGPFSTKEAAEKVQARAKAIGVDGSVAPK